jgi:hypothetical protein
LKTLTNQTERIAALIRDLDLVQAHQWGQPGGVALAEDPIVSALIQEGDPAVEPLLDCVEHDPRLTRSVSFGRDFFMSRNLIPASQAARSALPGILQAGFNDAAEIRGYWNQYKTLSLEERWHAMLRDDTARSRWLEAAGHIVQPKPITAYRGGFRGLTPPPAAPVRLRGERLRDKKNPAVTALLARRALEIPDANPKIYDLSEAGQMGLALAAWDPGAAGPVLQTLTKRCRTVMAYSDARLGLMLARLSLARAETGDPNAFEDYALWLPGTLPSQLDFSLAECLEPLEQFPTNILLQSVAEKLFTPANSAWSKLPWIGNAGINPASSDLVRVPAFRRLLVRELDRKEVCGTVSWQATGMVSYSMSNYWRGNFGYAFPEAGQTSDGASAELRWGDWIALSLSQAKIIPPFNPFAPVDKRDPPIRKAQETLAQP